MAKNLLIVESPAKAKTIEKYLGKDYQVKASFGHIRDLPKSKLGIDIHDNFKPEYIIPKKSQKTVNELKKSVSAAKKVYLATDLDREGEAISWHILKATGLDHKSDKVDRITFHEITKDAILDALAHPRKINKDLVDAQQARRVLDRLVGYKLSPLLWSKIRRGLSAGRVQSIALKLIIDREREIDKFVPKEYWSIDAILEKKKKEFKASLISKNEKKLEIHNESEAKGILKDLENADYIVRDVIKKEVKRNPVAPFITSTLQQDAGRKLGFSAKKTMMLAQQLYEGIDLGPESHVGLITYMRTDSTSLSDAAIANIRKLIESKYGKEYVPSKPRVFKKAKAAQEAHEAIRPTHIEKEPDKVKQYLSKDQYRLYALIWKRALASQMESAVLDQTSIDIKASDYIFRTTGSIIKFPGFTKVYEESKAREEQEEKNVLPELDKGEKLKLVSLTPNQHFTLAPPRYSEASLIKVLEEEGIGRPSTYAPTLSTLKDRGYIDVIDRKLHPKEIGFIVNDLLVENFSNIINLSFTAQMEKEFDEIAEGDVAWQEVIKHFWDPFSKQLEEKQDTIKKVEMPVQMTDEICPDSGHPMIIKQGRYGEFMACSGWPECKFTKPLVKDLGVKCPDCQEGDIIERRTKKGRIFYGCSTFPKCKFASWDKPATKPCPDCEGLMVEKGKTLRCIKCGHEEQIEDNK